MITTLSGLEFRQYLKQELQILESLIEELNNPVIEIIGYHTNTWSSPRMLVPIYELNTTSKILEVIHQTEHLLDTFDRPSELRFKLRRFPDHLETDFMNMAPEKVQKLLIPLHLEMW